MTVCKMHVVFGGGDNMSCSDCNGTPNGSYQISECLGCVDYPWSEYDCGDIQVLQDIIDMNPCEEYENENLWNTSLVNTNWENNRLTMILGFCSSLPIIENLPESMIQLTHLERLSIANPAFTSFPEVITNIVSLKSINMHDGQLVHVPESIGNLINLEILGLARNQITSIPETIGNLKNLRSLSLQENQIESLPESISNLTNLETLDIYRNQLTSLPENLCNIPNDCSIEVHENNLCEEYHYYCIDIWGVPSGQNGPQDQSNCCEGPEGQPNWTTCP